MLAVAWGVGAAFVIVAWCWRWVNLWKAIGGTEVLHHGREAKILRRLGGDGKRCAQIRIVLSRTMMEPGIFGIFDPVMIWPEKLTSQLTDEQIEAIMAHELAHLRRHDNLVALVHMLVEAIFWFHPMVWWIESRLVEERELACDEEAIIQVRSADIYAESLLKACRVCFESPLTCCPGIAGGNLRKRVMRITSGSLLQKLDVKRQALLCLLGLVSFTLPVLTGVAHSLPQGGAASIGNAVQEQSSTDSESSDKFEIVSIRQSRPDEDGGGTQLLPDGFRWKNMPLSQLVKEAYGIEFEKQLVGFPPSLDSRRFDIEARMSSEAASKWRTLPQKKQLEQLALMQRGILADRCQFRAHYESTEQTVYELVIAKGGVKMTRAADNQKSSYQSLDGSHDVVKGAPGNQIVHQIPVFDRLIIDKTGLGDERYDFDLKWSRGDEQPGDAAEGRPTIFKALEEQLGLKLVPTKGMVKALKVDHIEPPSPN